MKNYKLAIVGATGVVGRTALKVLEEKNLPISEFETKEQAMKREYAIKQLGRKEKQKLIAGKKVKFMNKEYVVKELTEHSFDEGFDFAIFSAGGETSRKYAPIAASKGCIVVDNSSAFRMDKDVPLVVPEVNPEEIKNNHGIIANPNCSTIQAVLPLKALDDKYTIKRIVYSTYQAVSGAGQKGLNDLENGRKGINKLENFPYPIYNNCLPHIDIFTENGYTKEEEKMINETRKILNKPNLKITATAVRVPVFNSHSEVINIELDKKFELNDIIELLKNSPNVIVQNETENNIYPIATKVSGCDQVFVGRIRRDFSVDNGLNLWVVADNIRKGAATNAIQIVEKLIEFDN